MIDRKAAPAIVDAVNFQLQLKPYNKIVLKNGIEVYAIDAGTEEVVAIEWVFSAGNSYEQLNLQAATANFMLKSGTSTKTAFQLNEHFDYYGSHLNRGCYNETAVISIHSLSKYLKELLPVVKEMITDSVFPEEELAIYKQNMKQRLKVNLKKSDFVAGRLIDTYLYGEEHPYGKFSKEEDFNAITREQVKEFYNKYYKEGELIIFAAGKLPADFEQLLNEYFGDLPNKKIETVSHILKPAVEKKIPHYQ